MDKKIVVIILFLLSVSFVSAKNYRFSEDLTVTFEDLGNCSDNSGTFDPSRTSTLIISNDDRELVQYVINCNESVTANNLTGNNNIRTLLEGDDDVFKSNIDLDVDAGAFCQDESFTTYSSLNQNLSYCYGTLQKIISLEETCIDNSGLAGEYRAKYDSCNSDYTECSNSINTIKSERDTYREANNNCELELGSTEAGFNSCNENKNLLISERDDYKEKSEQRTWYAIGGALIGGIGVYLSLTKGRRNPDYTGDEQELGG